MSDPIYLDYQATTPLAPEALAAMLPWLERGHWNPHSAHVGGRRAAAAVEVARDEIAALLPQGGRVIFTSGATEAINLALIGGWRASGRRRIVTIASEHAAVLDTCHWLERQGAELVVLPVDAAGIVDLDAARRAIGDDTGIVAAMLVNNEIGVVQPVAALADLAARAGALMLCDAVQGYGRVDVPNGPALIALSAHKIHGPKGIGALWIANGVEIDPVQHGGGQEGGLRSGTLSPALCAGFGAAARLMRNGADADAAHVAKLWDQARALLPGWTLNGADAARYRGNLNVRRDGIDVARLMSDLRGVAFSAGSACASGSGRPSHVLAALGLSEAQARASIRIGFGRYTTSDEIAQSVGAIAAAAARQLENDW